jgi:hypothetical protein
LPRCSRRLLSRGRWLRRTAARLLSRTPAILRPRLAAALLLSAVLEDPFQRLAVVRAVGCDGVLRRRLARLPTRGRRLAGLPVATTGL